MIFFDMFITIHVVPAEPRVLYAHLHHFGPLVGEAVRVRDMSQHHIRTSSEQSCLEVLQAPYNHPVLLLDHAVYSPSSKQRILEADHP